MHRMCSFNLAVLIYHVIHLKPFIDNIPVIFISGVILPQPLLVILKQDGVSIEQVTFCVISTFKYQK